MTGATGSLTPDDPDTEFVPAETREVSDPDAARDITAAAYRRRESRAGEAADQPGRLSALGDSIPPNNRDGGYGSEHGLSGADPAYRQEEHLAPPKSGKARKARETQLGGDRVGDPEDEHL